MAFYIKIITTLIPFLWEMMFGKEASLQDTLRGHKKAVIVVLTCVLSVTINIWLAVRLINISAKYVKLQQSMHLEAPRKAAPFPPRPLSNKNNVEYTQILQSEMDAMATQDTKKPN